MVLTRLTHYQFLSAWLPVVLWCGVIFFFSSLPMVPTPFIDWRDVIVKKTAHVTEYALLLVLVVRALRLTILEIELKSTLLISFTFSFVYALSDEFHQRFTPGRTGTIRDIGFDVLGMLLAIGFIYWLIKNRSNVFGLNKQILGEANV